MFDGMPVVGSDVDDCRVGFPLVVDSSPKPAMLFLGLAIEECIRWLRRGVGKNLLTLLLAFSSAAEILRGTATQLDRFHQVLDRSLWNNLAR